MENWTVHPNIGLGLLHFGMSQEQVSEHNKIYGDIHSVKKYGTLSESFLADLGPFAEQFSQEMIDGAKNAAKGFDGKTKHLEEEVRQNPYRLRLEYSNGKLASISVQNDCVDLTYGDVNVFSENPKNLLLLLQKENSGALAHADEVIYDKLGIIVSGFYFQSDNQAWRFYREDSGRPEGRFVTVFSPSEINMYLTDDFVEVDFSKN